MRQRFPQINQRTLRLFSNRYLPNLRVPIRRHISSESSHGGRNSSLAVMSFGDGSKGALGLPAAMTGIGADAFEPSIVPGLPSDVRSVSAGHYHSLAVTSQGEVWAWGRNDEGQLGRGLSATSCRDSWREPKRVEGLYVKVIAAFGSGVTSIALGEDGSLWVWGRSKRGQLGLGNGTTEAIVPSRVEKLAGEVIDKVAVGWGHALAQTVDGKLFGWGYSADGRLGQLGTTIESSPLESIMDMVRGITQRTENPLDAAEKYVLESMEENSLPIIWEPHLFEELRSAEVMDIACGLDHSLVLCRDGTLLSSGSNIYGQLGRSRGDLGLLPVDLTFRPVTIACGLGHSMAICEHLSLEGKEIDRKVVSWGWNHSSQLGRTGSETVPLSIEGFEEEIPVLLSGARVHSLALTSEGNLWAWGCGKNGRLGLGSSFDEPEPVLVDLQRCNVLQAVSGFDHNLLLVAE